jgi:hypothetical protein
MRQEKNTKVAKASCGYIGAWEKNLKNTAAILSQIAWLHNPAAILESTS